MILVKNLYREILSIFVEINQSVHMARTVRFCHMMVNSALQNITYRIYFIPIMSQYVR
jgi:hypothetical protein